MIIKIKARPLGAHYHIDIWMGQREHAVGKCGSLCFRKEEWKEIKQTVNLFSQPSEPKPIGSNGYVSIANVRNLTIILEEYLNEQSAEE